MSEAIAAAEEAPITLSKWLEQLIERLSDPAVRSKLSASADQWRLHMCCDERDPDASWAEVVFRDNLVLLTFQKKPRPDRVRNIVTIPFKALLICGELLEDSKAKLAAQADNQPAHV